MDAHARQISSSALLVALALACNVTGSVGARLLIWTPLLFFAPGYLLSDLLFKRDRLAALLIGVVLSICLDILGGMVLGFFGFIHLTGWSLWVCVMFGGCLFIRNHYEIEEAGPAPMPQAPMRPIGASLGVSLGASALMLVGAYWIAIQSEAADSQFSFIAFSMLPADTPTELTLGVTNEEGRAQAFRIEVATDGLTTAAWTTELVSPGETVQSKISVSPTARRVVARLFRRDDPIHIIRLVSRDMKPQNVGAQTR